MAHPQRLACRPSAAADRTAGRFTVFEAADVFDAGRPVVDTGRTAVRLAWVTGLARGAAAFARVAPPCPALA